MKIKLIAAYRLCLMPIFGPQLFLLRSSSYSALPWINTLKIRLPQHLLINVSIYKVLFFFEDRLRTLKVNFDLSVERGTFTILVAVL